MGSITKIRLGGLRTLIITGFGNIIDKILGYHFGASVRISI
jgi:hypothetical protein